MFYILLLLTSNDILCFFFSSCVKFSCKPNICQDTKVIKVSINTQVTQYVHVHLSVEMHVWSWSRCFEPTCQWWALCVAPPCKSSEPWDRGSVVRVRSGLQVWQAPSSLAQQLHLSQSQREPTPLKKQGNLLRGSRWSLMIQIIKSKWTSQLFCFAFPGLGFCFVYSHVLLIISINFQLDLDYSKHLSDAYLIFLTWSSCCTHFTCKEELFCSWCNYCSFLLNTHTRD